MSAITVLPVEGRRWWLERPRVSSITFTVGGLFLAGLALRLFWVFYTDTIPLGGDPHWYYVVGTNLAHGDGFVAARNAIWEVPGPGEPTAFWPPGYPFALAAVFKLFGVSVTAAQVCNAVLGALSIPLVFVLGRRIAGVGPALIAAAVIAVLPNAIAGVPLLFPEPLFTLILLSALWVLVTYPVAGRSGWLAVAGFGALVGMAALTRGQGSVLIPVAGLYWLATLGWRQAVRPTALAVLTAAALITPWTIRNAVELHALIPVSTNSAAALRVGHAPDSIGTTQWTKDYVDGFYMWQSIYHPQWEVRGYRAYTRRAIDYALSHPRREIELSGLKIYHLYRADSDVVPWLTTLGATPLEPASLDDALRHLLEATYYALVFVAVASMPLWLRRDPKRWLLVSVVLWWTAFHVVFLGEPRYHIPLLPLFAIAAAAGVWSSVTMLSAALRRRRPDVAASET